MAAFNEAGHAVAAYVLRRDLDQVSIADGQRYAQAGADRAPLLDVRPKVVRELVILLAGPAAVAQITQAGGDRDSEDVRADRWRAAHLATMLDDLHATANPPIGLDRFIEQVAERAGALIEAAWPAVEELARDLVDEESIEGREAGRIVEQALSDTPLARYGPCSNYLHVINAYLLPDDSLDDESLIDFDGLADALKKVERLR
jgi:hypothetical protein